MSTAQPSSHKSWWSRSKSSKDHPTLRLNPSASSLNEKQSMKSATSNGTSKSKDHSTSRFNSLVAAMGKKHKRPTLAIQDPPPPIPSIPFVAPVSPPPPSLPPKSPNPSTVRSPSSSRRTPVEINTTMNKRYHDMDQASDPHTISEPRTPSDHPRDRFSYQTSVMTLSDPDPFASAGLAFSPRVVDPNRLSVYSDSSLLDPTSKRPDIVFNNRTSYGSSSSNSHGYPSEGLAGRSHLQPPVPAGGPGQVMRHASDSSFGVKRHGKQISGDFDDASVVLPPNHFKSHNRGTIQESVGSASSHSTLTPSEQTKRTKLPRSDMSRTPHSSPPSVRARGMTVGGAVGRRPNTATGALERGHQSSSSSLLGGIQTIGLDASSSQTPGTSFPPSYSPITFNRNRSLSNVTDTNSPVSINGTRPLVLVRKASSPRVAIPPPLSTPPSSGLPPPPSSPGSQSFIDSIDDLSSLVFPDHPSSSSSSLSFASDTGFDMAEAGGDEIYNLMRDSFVDNEFRRLTPPQSPPATIRNINVGTPRSAAKTLSSRMHPGDTAHPKLLKKAVSQQNLLGKRFSGASVASSIVSGLGGNDDVSLGASVMTSLGMKIPRKQRSFHHPRIPLPPLPSLRHATSASTPPINSPDASTSSQSHSPMSPEHRKGLTSPQHTRKRLFSGSSTRRSSSSQPPASPISADEDVRSLVSLEGETKNHERRKPLMMSFSNLGNQISLVTDTACIAASWDEVSPPPLPPKESPRKRESQSEALPQRIMSPAAMLKLEEQLVAEAAEREREEQEKKQEKELKSTPKLQLDANDLGLSFSNRRPKAGRSRAGSTISDMSVATFGNGDRISPVGTINHSGLVRHEGSASKRSSIKTAGGKTGEDGLQRFPARSSSAMARRATKPPLLSTRPSTAQAAVTPPTSPVSVISSPSRPSTSLPPPPRPRPRRGSEERDEDIVFKRTSILPIHPLSPPPRRKSTKSIVSFEQSTDRHSQTRPPPSAFDPQKFVNRRSIVKRPSFLEIEDEGEGDLEMMETSPLESSFLDLDRGKDSFDTLRSFDEDLRVY